MAAEDALDVFLSSLHSLFDHVVPANGDPLELFSYNPPTRSSQPTLDCRIPPQQVNALFAHHVWNASLILADWISLSSISGLEMDASKGEQDEEGSGRMSVCELGCGAGIPGLIAARSPNVKRVVLTDYHDPLLIDNLVSNIELAYKDDERTRNKLRALGHTWGEEESLAAMLSANNGERFSHILMADTLWLTEAQTALVSSLSQLLAFTPSARIHLVAGFHSGRNAVRSFLRKAREAGFEEKLVDGKEWEELAVGGETRPWGWDLEGREDDQEWVEEKESNSERGKWVVVGEMGWTKEKLASLDSAGR
ncbi:uncharacterized protein JCM6883_000781 [Sporobolomyces salmoneus]|uniref:uncharacterized protein n=1 Tax=Sporobolomyces salmoneus TaxID=183962 RepID=UPI00318097E7